MLGMSKAFDAVDRTILLNYLSNIIDNDKLHLINMMLHTQLTIRCRKEEPLKTDIGIPQGDGLSAKEFTLYHLNALYKQNKYRNELQHKYEHFHKNLEYPDDISTVTTDHHTATHILKKNRIQTRKSRSPSQRNKNRGIPNKTSRYQSLEEM